MAKGIGSMAEELGNAVQAIARAKLTPEAVPVLHQLDQLQAQVTILAQHGNIRAGGPGAAGPGAPAQGGAPTGGPPQAPGPPAGAPQPGGLPNAPGQGIFPNSPIPNANELAALVGGRAGM